MKRKAQIGSRSPIRRKAPQKLIGRCERCSIGFTSKRKLRPWQASDGQLKLCHGCRKDLAAFPEIPSVAEAIASYSSGPLPMGVSYGAPQRKDWHAWVYGGERNPKL